MIISPKWKLVNAARTIGVPLLVFFMWDVVVVVGYVELHLHWLALDNLPMPLIGSALALLVAVRNNIAYARWWEARQLWGGIVNYSRTLARQTRLYLQEDAAAATALVEMQVAYAHALRCHLRRQPPWDDIAGLLTPEVMARLRQSSNVPDALLREMADRLAALGRAGMLDSVQLAALDTTLTALANMQGGAERIRNTPMSQQVQHVPHDFRPPVQRSAAAGHRAGARTGDTVRLDRHQLHFPDPRPHRRRPRESVRERGA